MGQGTPRYVFEIQGTFSVSDCSKLKENEIKKIENVEDIPDEFKNYGKKKEDVQTLEDQAKNWVWTPGK